MQIWLKKYFLHEFLLFYVQFFWSINFCFGPFDIHQFKTNCSVLKIEISTCGTAIYRMHITSLHFVVLHTFL